MHPGLVFQRRIHIWHMIHHLFGHLVRHHANPGIFRYLLWAGIDGRSLYPAR
jgi:hypothetical protein